MFKIEISKRVKKDLKNISKKDAEFIFRKINEIKESPLAFIKKLTGKTLWKLRAGDYRAITYLDTKSKIIYIVKIGHRKNIYKGNLFK